MVAKKRRQTKRVKNLSAKTVSVKRARQVRGGRPTESLKAPQKWALMGPLGY